MYEKMCITNPKNQNQKLEKVQQKEQKRPEYTVDEFIKLMVEKEKSINMELLRQHFAFPSPSLIVKILYNVEDKKRNNELVNLIKSGLSDLKDEIKRISEDEIKIEILDEIVDIVEMILKFT